MDIDNATTLRHIIRYRPMAVEVLERAAQHEMWNHLDHGFHDFCATLALDQARLHGELVSVEPAHSETDWDANPIYHLIDFLIQHHARFVEMDMPAILHLLKVNGIPNFPDKYVFNLVEQEFLAYREEFLEHIEEEEIFLFPKMMRNEACFRFKGLQPEVYKGSVNLYLASRRRKPEVDFNRALVDMKDKLRNLRVGEATANRLEKIKVTLENFDSKLASHTGMENQFLFPRAGRQEQELYEGIMPGFSRFPGEA
jgi:iron-sulfur cluster repair protein YtfE (RIC family)